MHTQAWELQRVNDVWEKTTSLNMLIWATFICFATFTVIRRIKIVMLRLICKQIPKEETSPTLTRPFPLSSVCRWLLCSLCEHSPLEELTHKIIYFILLYITYWEHSVLQENSFLVCIFRGKVLLFWPVSVSFRLSAVFFFCYFISLFELGCTLKSVLCFLYSVGTLS